MDGELEHFKGLNLGELARAYGFELDRKASSRCNIVMRHGDGDKIIIATGEDGHAVFYSTKTDASGSVIDFVMYRQACNLGHARKALRAYTVVQPIFSPTAPQPPNKHPAKPAQCPQSSPNGIGSHHHSGEGAKRAHGLKNGLNGDFPFLPIPKPQPIPKDQAALVAQWHRLAPYTGGYLQSRGLTADTINAFAHRLRLDERGNVAFRHDDLDGLTGWELKNQGFTGFARGGKKALFAARVGLPRGAPPSRLIVAESALDAMSYHQHDPDPALVLSFAGGLSPKQRELLHTVLTRYPAAEVITATDADPQGEDYAAFIQSIRPDAIRRRPTMGKDWNDAIRHPAP